MDDLIFEKDANGLLHQVVPGTDTSGHHRHHVSGRYFVMFTAEEEAEIKRRSDEADAKRQVELDALRERQAAEAKTQAEQETAAKERQAHVESANAKFAALGLTEAEIAALLGLPIPAVVSGDSGN